MITEQDVMHLSFLKKLPFKGSYQGMRYMLRAVKGEDEITALEALCWPGPLCFEATAQEAITSHAFEFSEAGISQAIAWFNEQYALPENQERWTERLLP